MTDLSLSLSRLARSFVIPVFASHEKQKNSARLNRTTKLSTFFYFVVVFVRSIHRHFCRKFLADICYRSLLRYLMNHSG